MRAFLLTLLLIVTSLASAQAQVLIFDFGTKDSTLWPSATRVTTGEHWWTTSQGLTDFDALGTGNPVWTNALTQDGIMGSTPNTFHFPVTPGTWHVYVISGLGGKRPEGPLQNQFWDFDVIVSAETWRGQFEAPEWSGPYWFPHHTFTVSSTGQIEVKLSPRSKWSLSGIIAWQQQDDAAAQKLIAEIEQWAPETELAKCREDIRPPSGPAPLLTKVDQARGFYVWHRHWATPIYPWTDPTQEEMNPTLRIFTSPGEYEPITFTVRPLRDIQQATVKVNALGPVPASAIEVHKVRFVKVRRNYSDNSGIYRIVPDILDQWHGGTLSADENATFWLTVKVPEGAKPGLYHGTIKFTADGKSADLPVLLRILDVKLQDDPQHTYGMYYDSVLGHAQGAPDEVSRQHWITKTEQEFADMVAHGTRNITLGIWSQAKNEKGEFGYLTESLDRLGELLILTEKYHFQPPYVLHLSIEDIYQKYTGDVPRNHLAGAKMPPDAFFDEVTDLVRTVEAERVKRSWPTFVYQPFDEPGSEPEVVAFMTRLFQATRAAGVRTYTTAAPEKPGYQPFKPYVDVWCTQTFLPDHDTVIADNKARGVEYWCYPNDISGENDHTPVAGARMTYGFGFWRSGFVRLIPWIYTFTAADPLNSIDGRMSDFMVRPAPDGSPIPTTLWESYREGYDDLRYLYTLQQLVAKAKASSSPAAPQAAVNAQVVLDAVWKAIPVQPQYQYESYWSPEEMDVQRWLVAEQAEKLTRLLR